MNPGLVVKLRPSGPWRIGPGSGARNRVDVIYHSDSLYSAVTAAMSRLGWLEEWLDATARAGSPAVSFSSCFPFLGETAFVIPPRSIWPPASHSTRAEQVRWKGARFVPLAVVQSIFAGERLKENEWSVDGPSDCLVPAGLPGPFRTAVRSNAGVDRLTGAAERHSTACLEFRPDSGLWTVAGFADEAARDAWSAKVKSAFRLLADSGFGGERSRGWGRSEAPEFTDGMLPDLILPAPVEKAAAPEPEPEPLEIAQAVVAAPPVVERLVVEPESKPNEEHRDREGAVQLVEETPALEAVSAAASEEAAAAAVLPEPPAPEPEAPAVEVAPAAEPEPPAPEPEAPTVEVAPVAEPEPEAAAVEVAPLAEPETPAQEPEVPALETASEPVRLDPSPEPEPLAPASASSHPHWLLSLFTPAAADLVDWRRGNYTVLPRGGRVESPAGSGELKKQIQMVAEGSVVYAEVPPRGSAADVAPDGFAHPVFRSGFALASPLPEVR